MLAARSFTDVRTKGTLTGMNLSVVLDLTFALPVRGKSEANAKSTALMSCLPACIGKIGVFGLASLHRGSSELQILSRRDGFA
jgi:hypothetical protein